MKELFWIAIFVGLGYWLYTGYVSKPEPAVVAATAATAVVATTAPSTASAAATGAVVGAAAATGFWAFLLGGGWFLGEMTLGLWFFLGGILLVPLCIIGWLCELPDDEEAESGVRIIGSFVLFAAMLFLLNWGGIPLMNAIRDNGIFYTAAFLLFIGVGVGWSVYKYDLLAKDSKKEIAGAIEEFCASMRLRVADVFGEVDGKATVRLSSAYKEPWEMAFSRHGTRRARSAGATAESPEIVFTRNKARITLWILFWPLSMVRGFFKDILARALDNLIEAMRKVYESVAKRHAIKVVYTDAASGIAPDAAAAQDDVRTRR